MIVVELKTVVRTQVSSGFANNTVGMDLSTYKNVDTQISLVVTPGSCCDTYAKGTRGTEILNIGNTPKGICHRVRGGTSSRRERHCCSNACRLGEGKKHSIG
jgi:hypothetical protein